MSKETVLKCDICRRDSSEMVDDIKVIRRKFKIKHFGLKDGYRNPWDNIDICSDCLDEIGRRVRGEKGGI